MKKIILLLSVLLVLVGCQLSSKPTIELSMEQINVNSTQIRLFYKITDDFSQQINYSIQVDDIEIQSGVANNGEVNSIDIDLPLKQTIPLVIIATDSFGNTERLETEFTLKDNRPSIELVDVVDLSSGEYCNTHIRINPVPCVITGTTERVWANYSVSSSFLINHTIYLDNYEIDIYSKDIPNYVRIEFYCQYYTGRAGLNDSSVTHIMDFNESGLIAQGQWLSVEARYLLNNNTEVQWCK